MLMAQSMWKVCRFTVKFFQLFWMFEYFHNKTLEKEVKPEWVAKTQMNESGPLLLSTE